MKAIRKLILLLLLASAGSLQGQNNLFIGMSANQFRAAMPGLLPTQNLFSQQIYLKETLHGLAGSWTFSFNNNLLQSASYAVSLRMQNKPEFDSFIASAKQIIADYTKLYGTPPVFSQGTNLWADRNTNAYEKNIGKREVFEEAQWKTNNANIKISCDYRSNYYQEFQEGIPNGPIEWYSYYFEITNTPLAEVTETKTQNSERFCVGMNVNDFAKTFPQLFPNGIGITGQWGRPETLYGLVGSWVYNFKAGKLNWMMFDAYNDNITQAHFDTCLKATRQLIADYTKQCGKPTSTTLGDTNFTDPALHRHWGYDVIKTVWKNYKGQKIIIQFTFMGGKGEYAFLVNINFFDKDYPYYD
ncbi:MAG: hypothetical protein WCQ95_07890 [Bacteroidota bacterium]